MTEQPNKIWFVSSAVRDIGVARDEPSHIHVARPSRRLRCDTPGASVESVDEVRELVRRGGGAGGVSSSSEFRAGSSRPSDRAQLIARQPVLASEERTTR
jgi:hypothetical protein